MDPTQRDDAIANKLALAVTIFICLLCLLVIALLAYGDPNRVFCRYMILVAAMVITQALIGWLYKWLRKRFIRRTEDQN